MTEPLVSISGLTKRFGDAAALRDITATIKSGYVTGLVGPDGAGKTTLIRIMTALMRPDEGEMTVFGRSVTQAQKEVHKGIGYMPQRFGLYEDLTVMENLRLYAKLRRLPPSERDDTYRRLLDFTGLEPFTERLAGKLSGGMKQKLGLACAMITRPKLLILDEPGVGVDPISRRELWSMVKGLTEDGTGIVWSTAYLDEAERCAEVIVLNEGRLIFEGAPSEMTDRVAGRIRTISDVEGDRRSLLAELLETEGVIDGLIQGASLRLVLAADDPDATDRRIRSVLDGTAAQLTSSDPRFEDAFIDALGGGPGGRSALAQRFPDRVQTNEPVVRASALRKEYGDFVAATGMDFAITPGTIFGLLGPNGAGKSTTFKMLCGLVSPTRGEGMVAGYDLTSAREAAKNRLGYMAQKFSLYGEISVRQNLKFFAAAYGLKGKKRSDAIEAMVSIFDLERFLDATTRELPLGYKQRLALACAVMHEPDVLFLDEPTSGVDPVTRREFWIHINGLVRRGVAVLVTTHFMEEAEYCDDMVLVYRGQIIARGAPDELKQQVRTEERPDPSMEDAFIALVEASDVETREAA